MREDRLTAAPFQLPRRLPDVALRAIMRRVEAGFDGWTITDAVAELRIWLDLYNCVPLTFEILKQPTGGIWLRVEFSDDALAEAFEREFGR